MKHIFIIGAGRSATDLIQYLLSTALQNDWHVVVGDFSEELAIEKVDGHPRGTAVRFDATDLEVMQQQVSQADLVVSFLPHHMHVPVAKACLRNGAHLVTASYVAPELAALDVQAREKGLTFLGEMGADPGIDHMGAMKHIDEIRERGGSLTSYKSYCGALIAPESNDNPWGYKFTWNPMNIIVAGQGTARFIENNKLHYIPYHSLFDTLGNIHVPGYGNFDAYANRDSLAYRKAYGLEDIPTLFRATLRMPGFCQAWHCLVQLGLTDNSYQIPDAHELTYRDWLEAYLPPASSGMEVSQRLAKYLNIPAKGELMERLQWAGLMSERQITRKNGTPAQILLDLLIDKLAFHEHDTDMLVLYDHFQYTLEGKTYERRSHLVTKGLDTKHTAISRTVGLPAAIGAQLILQDKIKSRGVMIPTLPEIYRPVLEELEHFDIRFKEEETCLQLH